MQTAVGCGLLPMDPSIGVGGDILEAVFHRLRVAPGRVVERLGQIMSWIAQGAEAQDIHAVDVVNDRHVGIELSFAPKRDIGQSAQFQIGFLIVAAVPIGEGLAAKKGSALLHRVKKLGIPQVAQGTEDPIIRGIISYNAPSIPAIPVKARVVAVEGPQRAGGGKLGGSRCRRKEGTKKEA